MTEKDRHLIASLRHEADVLAQNGDHARARDVRDSADRLHTLTGDQLAPHASVPLPDGTSIAVVQYGDLPRLKAAHDLAQPVPQPEFN